MKIADYKVLNIMPTTSATIPPGVKLIGADQMWDFTKRGLNTVVAIIDTGIDINHPDLKQNILAGMSFVPGQKPDQFYDENGHGTHVAGTICANGKLLGAAPMTKMLVLKVFGPSGESDDNTIARAFKYAANWRGPHGEKVNVINASLGGPQPNTVLEDALKYCVSKDILCCCAAGNEGDGNSKTFEYSYPAMYYDAFSIGAIDFKFMTTNFSNTNNEVDVSAPGSNIISTYLNGQYAELSGTSMATPHVAGLSLLYIAKFMNRFGRRPTETELYILVKALSKDIGIPGLDPDSGAGVVQQWL